MYSFPNLEPVHCSMSSSNCCFLTCLQVSQETSKVIWYSHLFKNFTQFFVTHRVKSFSVVNETELDVFLEFFCFCYDSADVGSLISGTSAFSFFFLSIAMLFIYLFKFLFLLYFTLQYCIGFAIH